MSGNISKENPIKKEFLENRKELLFDLGCAGALVAVTGAVAAFSGNMVILGCSASFALAGFARGQDLASLCRQYKEKKQSKQALNS